MRGVPGAANNSLPKDEAKRIICSAKRPTRVATSLLDVFHAIVISNQFVCTKYVTLSNPVPQFGVSFPEKLLKIVATRCEIFTMKFTKYRLGQLSSPMQTHYL